MSSQANVNPQSEPTMEEILASIRKIISEDQPAEVAKPAAPVAKAGPAKPLPVPAAEPVVARVAAPAAPAGELDVLELTEEVHEDGAPEPMPEPVPQPVRAAPPMPAPPIEDDVIFQNIEPVSRVKEPPMDDDLISDTTRSAVGRAFANVNGQGPQVSLKGGSIEAIFADAVQQAFRPALKEWIDDHSNDVMDQLRPLIRAWMDEHLPPLVEAAVAKEIARAAARKP